jgi:hypothetical protein
MRWVLTSDFNLKKRRRPVKHPKTIEEISAPWMTDVLRGAGILRRATVLAVDVHAIGQGVGFLSGRARVTLTYDQAEEGARRRANHRADARALVSVYDPCASSPTRISSHSPSCSDMAPRTPIRVHVFS